MNITSVVSATSLRSTTSQTPVTSTLVTPDSTSGGVSTINMTALSIILSTMSSNMSGNAVLTTNTTHNISDVASFVPAICVLVLCTDDKDKTFIYSLCQIKYDEIVSGIQMYSESISTLSKVFLSTLLVLITLAAVCGNFLVVMTFALNKHMRSVTNVFILSLAASDLMVAFTCIPLDMANELTPFWEHGQFACKLVAFVSQFSVACSSLTLCCIAFDRYYAIVHPLKLKFLQTPRRAAILQSIVLAISGAASFEYAFFFDLKKVPVCEDVDEAGIPLLCVASDTDVKKIFEVWITLLVLLCGPLIFMSIMYGLIGYNLWAQRPIGARLQKQTDGRMKLKKRAVKMLVTVVCIFALCRSPLLLFNAIAETNHLSISMSNINWRAYLQCLSLSSACWNPIVYAFMNEKFRKAFLTLLRCNRRQVHPIMKRNNTVRMSTESRKTTSQLELPALAIGSQQTAESRA